MNEKRKKGKGTKLPKREKENKKANRAMEQIKKRKK